MILNEIDLQYLAIFKVNVNDLLNSVKNVDNLKELDQIGCIITAEILLEC